MARTTAILQSFNRGIVSSLGLARTDIGPRIAFSATQQTNWMPRALGSMMLRAGLGYTGATKSNLLSKSLEFVFSLTDTARVELTDGTVRVWISDTVLTRPSVTSAIANPYFGTDLASWTDNDEGSAVSSWLAGGYMSLLGSGSSAAIRDQLVTCSPTGTEHAVRLIVTRGVVSFRIGTTLGDDDVLEEKTLTPGSYSLSFTPSADFYVRISSVTPYASLVTSCAIESAGAVELISPWGASDLSNIRYTASGDVIFVACQDIPLTKIARYGARSWAVVDDVSDDGPMRLINSTPITLTPSAVNGDITITASKSLFRSGHLGALFSIISTGQVVNSTLNGSSQFTDPILVTGVLEGRTFTITTTGTWVGTLTLQRSVGVIGSWTDEKSWTANTTNEAYLDNQDNAIIYYRIGFKAAAYTSGAAVATLTFLAGSITGYARVTEVTSDTVVSAIVLKDFGGTVATDAWSEGAWSVDRGFPGAIALHENRKWLAGKDKMWASVSGSFQSFDDSVEGDSAPISKSIGYGPIDTINWLVSAERMLVGAQLSEITVRSSSLDEPLTAASSSIKSTSTQGSAAVAAINVDGNAIFIQRCGRRIYTMLYDTATYGYGTQDLTSLSTEIAGEGSGASFVQLAVQRQPDTRIHARRADGKVAVVIFDKAENVNCWVLVETDGIVEDICVLPGEAEDIVYYTVKRTINGSTKRYHERWALEEDCQGGLANKQADSFVYLSRSATTSVTGADHLEGETVVAWGDGVDLGTYTVSGGTFTLSTAAAEIVYGLPYEAQYKSTKLAYGSQKGTALTQPKRVNTVGVIMKNTHVQGLKYGRDFDHLDNLPLKYKGKTMGANDIYAEYDGTPVSFGGAWDSDSRLCLQAAAPRPCTLLAAIIEMDEVDM